MASPARTVMCATALTRGTYSYWHSEMRSAMCHEKATTSANKTAYCNDGVLDDDVVPLVIATLVAAGVPEKRASDVVVDVSSVINAKPGLGDGT